MQNQIKFQEIYLKYSDKIYKYIYMNTGDPYLSEDITSEVFLKIWKKWENVKLDFIQALLYKSAKNTLIDFYRKRSNAKKVSLEEMTEMGIEPHYDEDLISKIHKDNNIKLITEAIKNLPENLREVMVLRFADNLSAKETAHILGITEINVRVLQYRGLKKLKEVFKNE